MPTDLRWIVSRSASAFHAAETVALNRTIADVALADAVREPAGDLATVLFTAGVPAEFWEHVTALSAGVHDNRELAGLALAKTIGRSARQAALVDPLAAAIRLLEKAYDGFSPDSNDQIEVRSGPLREQWEARGPGVLAYIGRSTDPELIVPQADVLLVHPISGGGGAAHAAYNSVRMEAVLVNPRHELPEVLRLAWLLAQLNHDLPLHQGNLARQRTLEVGALAMIPPTLAAAEEVELSHYDARVLKLALEAWHVPVNDAAATAQVLEEWWEVYSQSRPPWSVALAALERMLKV